MLAVWTARLAITKGRNAWAWGGAALILGLLPWHLFGVLPVLLLLFTKQPSDSTTTPADRLACARCAKSHSEGQHFCTGCGWDLSEAYSPEEPDEGQPFPSRPQVPTTVPSTGVAQPPETAEAPVVEPETPTEPEPSEVVETPVAESAPAADETPDAAPEMVEEEPEKEHVPWGTYDVGVAPTAAVMVSRGIERFDEGKFQEAIDQFTKAIALDPNYAEAGVRKPTPNSAGPNRRKTTGGTYKAWTLVLLRVSSSPG